VASTRTSAFAVNNGWGPYSSRHSIKSNTSSAGKLSSTIQNTAANNSQETSSLDINGNANDTTETENENENTQVKTADVLSLDSIRSTLIRQEETIIFAIIERAQYRCNSRVYKKRRFSKFGPPIGVDPSTAESTLGTDENGMPLLSFLEYMLIGTEVLHCAVRRYTSPEEHPFFPQCLTSFGPNAALPELEYPTDLLSPIGGASSVNFNPILLKKYIEWIVPSVTKKGDDEQHGSTVLADMAVLQALSKRVHYGKFVAESKYRSDPEGYQHLVDNDDAEGVMELLTNAAVEEKVLRRARLKAATYGREPLMTRLPEEKAVECSDSTSFVAAAAASAVVSAFEAMDSSSNSNGKTKNKNSAIAGKVDPGAIEDIYRKFIIPLTKDIEVAYLFKRCGKEPPPEYAPHRLSVDLTISDSDEWEKSE